MFRGVRRLTLFQKEEDYHIFIKLMDIVKERYPFEVNSYCLMTNHVHLLLTTIDDEIWKIMKMLLGRYAMQFNHRYGYTGHVFEKRYTSFLVKDPAYFLEVSRYIHLNPVRAGMVEDPLDYKYSSYAAYIGRKEDSVVSTEEILNMWEQNGNEQYRLFVEGKINRIKGQTP